MGSCASENATIRDYILSFANKQDPALDRPFDQGASLGEICGSTGVPSSSPRPRFRKGLRLSGGPLGSGHGLPLRALPRAWHLSPALHWGAAFPSPCIYCVCFPFWLAWSSARQCARRLTSQGLSSRRETWQKVHLTKSSGSQA